MLRRALAVLAASPALLPLVLILKHSVDMPYWDHWNRFTAGLYIKAHQGQLTLHDLLALQNEHRPVVPRLIYLGLNVFTHWNTTVECLVEWGFMAVVSAALLLLLRNTVSGGKGGPSPRVLLLWFLCNVLLFSPAQWENLLFGMGLINVLPLAFVSTTLVVLASRARPWVKAVTAMLLSSITTYTNGCGLFYWPLIAAALAAGTTGEERVVRRRILGAYGAWAALNIALYFVGYTRPSHGGAQLETLSPVKLGVYTLAFLGNLFAFTSVADPTLVAEIAGFLTLALLLASLGYFLFTWRRLGERDGLLRALPWLVVGGSSVLNAFLSSFSRAGGGAPVAISSRYVTFSLFLPVALVVLVPLVCEDLRRRSGRWTDASIRIPAALGAVLVLMALAVLPGALTACEGTERRRREGKAALLLMPALPNDPHLTSHVCAEIDLLRTQAPLLSEIGYLHPKLIAGNDASRIEASSGPILSARGALDQASAIDAERIQVGGWAVIPERSRPADAVFLTYDDEQRRPIIFSLADIGRERADVAYRERRAGYLRSGWVAIFPRRRLPAFPRTTITAWALDTNTGTARRLEGAWPLEP